ncbi:hypothetical protein I5907_01330 [Panacibacter sp. DH6]|uniref:Lipoprotein n=1 Tax=Panacibacter microcysteis TaxID=2793269 RepID=A0A931GSW0_9BACT|nr:hypothetical protein [Panacibacter microcysteis]MBG9374861.1 hypothetical protein [Panacibacter microcysteis]
MRKNILFLLALSVMSISVLTGCSKKAVVPPKQTDKSAASAKTGTNTGGTTNQGTTQHTCGGNGYGGSSGSGTGSSGY